MNIYTYIITIFFVVVLAHLRLLFGTFVAVKGANRSPGPNVFTECCY